MSDILNLYKRKESCLKDMLKYAENTALSYTTDEKDIDMLERYIDNLGEHIKGINALQAEINKYKGSSFETDKEVCEIENRCKKIAKKIYDIDKAANDEIVVLSDKVRKLYLSAKKQVKYTGYSGNVDVLSESVPSFDISR